jgi:uncharacterized protein (TIGR03000 family)
MPRLFRRPLKSLLSFGFVAGAIFSAFVGKAIGQEPPKPKTVQTIIKVTVPDKDAELIIEKIATNNKYKKLVREFTTPPLEAGKKFSYDFSVKWRPNNYTVITREQTVTFLAGEDITIDLSKDSPDGKVKAVIRFVPTPDDIVEEMVKLAKITKDDVVFEPGCGKSAMLIAALKAGAKKGVGIDIDPERVKESKEEVKKAGLVDKIDIREGDALEQPDYGSASVIMLYMGDEFNSFIRPTLLRDLKVGSRIVSHRFTFEKKDWTPDETKKITGVDGLEYEVHIWIVTEDAKKLYGAPAKKN